MIGKDHVFVSEVTVRVDDAIKRALECSNLDLPAFVSSAIVEKILSIEEVYRVSIIRNVSQPRIPVQPGGVIKGSLKASD